MNEQNTQWLKNRPLWKVDKEDPILLKNPTRWLLQANISRSTPKMGWLEMRDIVRASEIANSKSNRK